MALEKPAAVKAVRGRSPSYPAIDLESAIARARDVWQKERESSAPVNVIMEHWGYAPGSSNGLVTLAALIKFGLLADEGSGDKRKARITELARSILLDDRPASSEREAAIREAALNPTIHKALWEEYKDKLPSDQNLSFILRSERKFTDSAAIAFLKELRSTWAFSKLAEYASMSEGDKDKLSPPEEGKVLPGSQTPTLEKPQKPAAAIVKYSWPLSKNLTAEVTISGSEVGPTDTDLEMLRKYLDLAKEALKGQT